MAKRTEILLVQDVLKLGNMGDLVRVAPGYARNYLYPYGLAIPAGAAAKRQIEVLREKAAKSEAERESKAIALKKTVDGMTVQVAARVASDIELFGSIGTKEIVTALAAKKVVVDGKQVHLIDRIKRLGRYQVEVRLHKNVPVTVTVEVVNSDPNALPLDEALKVAAELRKKKVEALPKDGEAAAEGADAKPAEGKAEAKTEAKPAKGEKAEGKAEKKTAKKDKG